MTQYTNLKNVSLAMAVWLMYDEYDYTDDPTIISTTTLLKPIRSIVLARKHKDLLRVIDISALIPSRMGSALHAGVEKAWLDRDNVNKTLKALGMSAIIPKLKINPNPEELDKEDIPVWIEQRVTKPVGFKDYKLSGKFDLVINGRVIDLKSTSVWTYIFGSNTKKYIQQGSIYRWLNPDKIKDDIMQIEFIFTDWSASQAERENNYPKDRILVQELPLMSLQDTEKFILSRIKEIGKYMSYPDDKLPECTEEELWARPPKWKYYKNPQNKKRATKNYDNEADAMKRLADDGFVGEVVKVEGEVIACKYCPVVNICDQAQKYIYTGRLKGIAA